MIGFPWQRLLGWARRVVTERRESGADEALGERGARQRRAHITRLIAANAETLMLRKSLQRLPLSRKNLFKDANECEAH